MFRVTDLKTVTVATSDLDAAVGAFRASFGLPLARAVEDAAAATRSAFLSIGAAEIEMTSPAAAGGPLAAVLAERGGGLYRLVLEVDDLDRARSALAARGIELRLELRADGRRVGWLDPGRTHGVPIALIGR